MTIVIQLNSTQIQSIVDENVKRGRDIENTAQAGAVPPGAFVFFAAFDGTNNNMDDLKGDRFCTNVGQLWTQFQVAASDNFRGRYYSGLGTAGKSTKETWFPPNVTKGVIQRAEQAYTEFAAQASDWLRDHASGTVTVAITAFSRGTASAAIFAQLLYQRGLASGGKVLIQPGKVQISAGVMFDPVSTGVEGNLAYPPNTGNVVIIKALNEYRQFFKAVDYPKQKDLLKNLALYGNHCDVGGGYDNGLAALSLDAATKFFQKSGIPILDVPDSRKFQRNEVAVHSERKDDHGNEIWDVYNQDGFSFKDERLFDRDVTVNSASSPGPSGTRNFVLYDGSPITL